MNYLTKAHQTFQFTWLNFVSQPWWQPWDLQRAPDDPAGTGRITGTVSLEPFRVPVFLALARVPPLVSPLGFSSPFCLQDTNLIGFLVQGEGG